MDAAEVHAELVSLHGALQEKKSALVQREAQLVERESKISQHEANVARDQDTLRALLEEEALRLTAAAGEQIDAASAAQTARLEAALGTLQEQCVALAKKRRQKQKSERMLKSQLPQPVPRPAPAPPPPVKSQPAPPPPQSAVPSPRVRELEQQLERSRQLSASLLHELEILDGSATDDQMPALETTRRNSLPGAADALIADGGALTPAARSRLLSLLWRHTAATPSAMDTNAPLWERRAAAYLTKAAAADAPPLFGPAASETNAPLAALLLLRLGRRAHQRGGTAAAGLGEMGEALSQLKRLGGGSAASRAKLLELKAVDEMVPVLRLSAVHAQLGRAAATALIALCATAPPDEDATANVAPARSMAALATPAFVDAALAALEADGTAEGPEPIGACVSLLLQRLSAGPPRWRALLTPAKLRRAVCKLRAAHAANQRPATADGGVEFVLVNLHSALRNVELKGAPPHELSSNDDEAPEQGLEQESGVEAAAISGVAAAAEGVAAAAEGVDEAEAAVEVEVEESAGEPATAWKPVQRREQAVADSDEDADDEAEEATEGVEVEGEEAAPTEVGSEAEEEEVSSADEAEAEAEAAVLEVVETMVSMSEPPLVGQSSTALPSLASLQSPPQSPLRTLTNRASAAPLATPPRADESGSKGMHDSTARAMLDLEAAYFSPGIIVPGTRE